MKPNKQAFKDVIKNTSERNNQTSNTLQPPSNFLNSNLKTEQAYNTDAIYISAKEKLRKRLVESGIPSGMPLVAKVDRPMNRGNLIPSRVIQGHEFYNKLTPSSNQQQLHTTMIANPTRAINLNNISNLVELSNRVSMVDNSAKKPSKLPPLESRGRSSSPFRNRTLHATGYGQLSEQTKKYAQKNFIDLLNEDASPDHNESNMTPIKIGQAGLSYTMQPNAMSMNFSAANQARQMNYTMGAQMSVGLSGSAEKQVSFNESFSQNLIGKLTGRNLPPPRVYTGVMERANRRPSARSRSVTQRTNLMDSLQFDEDEDEGASIGKVQMTKRDSHASNLQSFLDESGTEERSLSPATKKEDASPKKGRVGGGAAGEESHPHHEIFKLKDIDSFIFLIKEGKISQSEFIYLVKGSLGDPYNLKVVEFSDIKDKRYYTLSAKGICRFENNEPQDYTTLKEWLQERDKYNFVKRLSFFKRFRKWKTLKKWHLILQRRKRNEVTSQLKDKLFLANPIMQRIILQHKQYCVEIEDLRVLEVGAHVDVQPLAIFANNQEKKRSAVVEDLQSLSNKMHENSRVGVKKILEKLRDQILSEMSNDEDERKQEDKEVLINQAEKQKKAGGRNIFEALGFPEFLNYGHRSMLRHVCTRFLRLAYLLDFMAVEALGVMYINSASDLLDRMQGLFEAHVEGPKLGKEPTKQHRDPLFLINVDLNADEISPHYIAYKEVDTKINELDEEKELKNYMDLDLNVYCEFDVDFDWDEQQKKQEEEAKKAKSPTKKTKKQEEEERRKQAMKTEEIEEEKPRQRRYCDEIHRLWMALSPEKVEFSNLLENFFLEGVECIQVIERWSKHKEFLPYANALEEWDEIIGDKWIMPDNIYLNPMPYLRESKFYNTFLQNMNTLLNNSFNRIETFLGEFRPYLNFYWIDITTDYSLLENELMKEQNKIYQALLNLYRTEQTMFEEELIQYSDLGLFRLNVDNVRKILQALPAKNLKRLEYQFPEILRTRMKNMIKWLTDSKHKLSGMVAQIEDFISLKSNLMRIMGQYTQKKKLINNINGLYGLLADNAIQMPGEIRDGITNMNALVGELNQQIEQAEYNTTKNTDRYIKALTEKIGQLKIDAMDLMVAVSQDKYLQDSVLPIAIIDELDAVDRKVTEVEGRTEKFKSYEEILQVQEYGDFTSIEELRTALNLRSTLWKSREEWKKLTQEWLALPFKMINAKEISMKAEAYGKILYRCEKNLPENSVVQDLRKSVFKFRDSMPIVTALRSQYLSAEHWEEIKQLVQVDFDIESEEFTMQSLVDFNFAKYQEEIIGIQTQAAQEHFLDQQITALENNWKGINLVVKVYKETRESYILVELDDIFQVLDESLATMNNILASRYLKKLRPKAEGIKNTLLQISDILDKWVECQKKWMYLENIFTAQDIKKQLEKEAAMFDQCDKTLRNLLKRVQTQPNAYRIVKLPNLFESLNKTNDTLDYIEKELKEYLEVKRGFFPRFYFLSNDELIEILANSQDIDAIQKHLRKCFENIVKLDLKSEGKVHSILGMISGEGEIVKFKNSMPVRGNVEVWLDQLQKAMVDALRLEVKLGLTSYFSTEYKSRNEWVLNKYGQVVSTVSQMLWCASVEEAINENEGGSGALQTCLDQNLDALSKLTELVRGNITSLQRKIVVALITQDVHARDIVEKLVIDNVESTSNFNWEQQLRYYWQDNYGPEKIETCVIRQVTSTLQYGYEYLGATSRLVITPLTDRCWITITGALHMKLGAAPAGPAGTGKTESTKDLAKGLGQLCIVFNCSDQVTTMMMSQLFAGLAQQGAWTCLDEFNRIDIEVLSVIAQQLLVIRLALLAETPTFNFEGREMPLKPNGVFITMNPGYAGRTELPDNLKVLFRPVSMMIPDYGLIAEIMLFAEGFQNAKSLSKKMVQLYKLSSEQLSQQDHYDFGMRAVKSVLVMAGSLKRQETKLEEDVVLIRAMRDSNVPKFLKDDLPLFQGLVQDLFPNVVIPDKNYGELMKQIKLSIVELGLQEHSEFELKVTQLFDTFDVRFGVMLVGPTGGGKTQCYHVLQHAMIALRKAKSKDARFQNVKTHVLNPKCIKMGELYGEVNPYTQEWQDGLASTIIRDANRQEEDPDRRDWIVFDGPVDALWIENMNTVLDDNMTLCLANGERIKLRSELRMLFEVQDLAVASPATVSRCGMVYVSSESLGWLPYVKSWMQKTFPDNEIIPDNKYKDIILNMFLNLIDPILAKMKLYCTEPIPTVTIQRVRNVCNFVELLINKKTFAYIEDAEETKRRLNYLFCYAVIWGMGASIDEKSYDRYDFIIKDAFKSLTFPRGDTPFDFYLEEEPEYMFSHWEHQVPEFEYNKELPYFQLLVPTVDTTKYSSIIELLVMNGKPTFLTGVTGVGKTVVIQNKLFDLKENKNASPISLTFSAQTESMETQLTIENKLSKKTKTVLGARPGQRVIIFIDDINMPSLESYGAQPCIELLRQLVDQGGFYDRQKLFWKSVEDSVLLCCAAPPGGGRNPITPRFIRQFNVICSARQSDKTMAYIFGRICEGFFQAWGFSENVKRLGESVVQGTVDIYTRISTDLLPTPARFHYVFNLRDISKVFQGFLMVKPQSCNSPEEVARLWAHENARVFGDRLINSQDRDWFLNLLIEISNRYFRLGWTLENVFIKSKINYGDLMKLEAPVKLYEEIKDRTKLLKVLEDKQEEHNMGSSQTKLSLVFFEDAVEHILRISRILRQPRGNAMLIGVGGSGKQSLARLSSFCQGNQVFQIELTKNYNADSFKGDLMKLMQKTGVDRTPITFIFTDSQVVHEVFLEYINNMLNSGEVPNLFSKKEDLEDIINGVRPYNKELKRPDSPEVIYNTFLESVRDNLHIVLCMSPVGENLRVWCRKFPSLINCCTLDWFSEWPREALISVSYSKLADVPLPNDNVRKAIAEACMQINKDVEVSAVEFFNELKRKVYNTPKSYLDQIALYVDVLSRKREEVNHTRSKLREGMEKLHSTNELVANLKIQLKDLQPQLEIQQEKTEAFLKQLEIDAALANEKEASVKAETEIVQRQTEEVEGVAKEAEAELSKALPALKEAEEALGKLQKSEITEIRTFTNPPDAVRMVMEAVCILLGEKTDWASAKLVLNDMDFLGKLNRYDKANVPDRLLARIRKDYTSKAEFEPESVGQKSAACKGICLWVRAVDNFAKVNKEVEPKKKKMLQLQEKMNQSKAQLAEKTAELEAVQSKLAQLKEECDETVAKKEELAKEMDLTEKRLQRAEKLTGLLAEEGVRWKEILARLNVEVEQLVGNAFLAASTISYMGPFTGPYRKKMLDGLIELLAERSIPFSENYSLSGVVGDALLIREWCINGLPTDSVSIDNAIITSNCRRWPLMIDPQIQANKWIKNIEKAANLKVMKFSDGNLLKNIQGAISVGLPVLIEDIEERLEPAIDTVLTKAIVEVDGRKIIRVGDTNVDWSPEFRLYFTTKLPNPHYLPEVCIKVTVINFTVTFEGLQDQLLGDVVKQERPDVEKQKDEIVVGISTLNRSLKELQDRILELLANSKGLILDDLDLIAALETSKIKSAEITKNLAESAEVEVVINQTRAAYMTVATRGTILYFVIADLSSIDPMYQYSLEYFKRLFNIAIEQSEKSDVIEDRLQILINNITKMVYVNICRGLFEAHKKIFSFLICTSIERRNGGIAESDWGVFLRGPPQSSKNDLNLNNPDPKMMTQLSWEFLQYLSLSNKAYENLSSDIIQNLPKWEGILYSEEPYHEIIQGYEHLTPFQKLLLLRAAKPESMLVGMVHYVSQQMGKFYEESAAPTLEEVYADSDFKTPVIFILSQGADPSNALVKFSQEKGYYEQKFVIISLGQGQGKKAEFHIEQAKREGGWVLLQNCHLAKSWMPMLEAMVEQFAAQQDSIESGFRLFLTSMPANYFPVSVLQNGVKMTTEPPRGLKANLKRSYQGYNQNYIDECDKPVEWKKLLFGLTFFHAIVQERRKFGPLGFNKKYEFNDSDLDVSCITLKMFLSSQNEEIPWDALLYVTGQINYGGRVTDDWDRRCLMSILKKYVSTEVLAADYTFSDSGIYYVPKATSIEDFRGYIESLPNNDNPEVFGMHDNANIVYMSQESNKIFEAILTVQPRISDSSQEKSTDDQVLDIAKQLLADLPVNLYKENGNKKLFEVNAMGAIPSLSTVLLQELERFNKLLDVMRATLAQLQSAIKGFILMSGDLDQMYNAFLLNQLPQLWKNVSYDSLKPLGSWYKDLLARVEFMEKWLMNENPPSYWLSGFFFPHGFITGVLQTHARRTKIPIDKLNFKFKVMNNQSVEKLVNPPKDGVYVFGLFLEGARWDESQDSLVDAYPGELTTRMPVINFIPMENHQSGENDYSCPIYKTSVRVGVLSTTGQSTNFILAADLNSKNESKEFWTLRGTALLCQLDT